MRSLVAIIIGGILLCTLGVKGEGGKCSNARILECVNGDGAVIQKAIDQAANAGGGKVVVKPGLWPLKKVLYLKSHVELHLEKGAVIQGSTNGWDYAPFPREVALMPRALIQAWNAEDIAITGAGDFDGNGLAFFDTNRGWQGKSTRFYDPKQIRPLMVSIARCRNIRFEGVGFLNAPNWTMRLRLCENLDFRRIRVKNNLKFINADGIDFDGCRHVRVTDSDFYTGDDCIIARAIQEGGGRKEKVVMADMIVSNCRLESACQCIRIGCPSDDTIRDLRFMNITAKGYNGVLFGNPSVYLDADDEGYVDIHNVLIENFSGEFENYAFCADVESGVKIRGIKDLFFINCDVKSGLPLTFKGNIYSPINRVHFKNVTHNGQKVADGVFATDCTDSKPLKRKRPGEYNYIKPTNYVAPLYVWVGETSGKAIQKAIEDVAKNDSGGVVCVPAGKYDKAALTLKSHVELRLAAGAVIKGDGTNTLLKADNAQDVALTGMGALVGGNVVFTRCCGVRLDGVRADKDILLAFCEDVQKDEVRGVVRIKEEEDGAKKGREKEGAPPKVFECAAGDGKVIQEAIDAAEKAGGGKVVVKSGVWKSGTLYLKSHVELHLAKGACIQGGGKSDDYADVETTEGIYPENSKKAFIVAENAQDIAITGEGVIDGVGPAFYDTNVPKGEFFKKPPHPRPRMVQFLRCKNVRLQGATFKDSPGWTMWLRFCENVEVAGICVVGHQQMINNDGIDFDGCRHVHVHDSFFKTGDDCLILRAMRGKGGAVQEAVVCEDVVVENCSLDSACQCVRIGCPSDDTVRDAVFRNIKARGRNGILSFHPYHYLRPDDHGYFKCANLLFENWNISCYSSPIVLRVDKGITLRDFGHFTFRNFTVRAVRPFELMGCYETIIRDVTFENMRGVIAQDTPFLMESVEGIEMRNVSISSGPGKPNAFKGRQGNSWETKK